MSESKKPKFLKIDDSDELIGELTLLDVDSIAVAARTHGGELIIIYNDSERLETMFHEVSEVAAKLPIDAEIVEDVPAETGENTAVPEAS